jgi:hypothetical protein
MASSNEFVCRLCVPPTVRTVRYVMVQNGTGRGVSACVSAGVVWYGKSQYGAGIGVSTGAA